jgi:hypothetical protein
VAFRGTRESFNQRYDVAARRGGLYLRGHAGDGRGTGPWRRLTLPPCMEGRVREVAIDRDVLIAIDGRRNLYSSGNALEPVERLYESWTMLWGPVLWSGAGVRLPAGTRAWNASGLTTADDRWFLDGARRRQDVIGVATVYALGGDGSRITYLDPWLPSDESYEVCAPRRGRFRAVALAGSGSTVLLQGRAGELYTRQYDFDISGADIAQLRYSWEDQRGVADPAIQLPPLGWRRQPDIPGRPTTRISIHTTGAGSLARVLRVEGLDRRGRRGYWEKRIAGPRWRFVATGLSLRGRLLAANARPAPLVPARAAGYAGRLADGTRVELRGFHPYCSPAPLRLIAPSGRRVTLTLHRRRCRAG